MLLASASEADHHLEVEDTSWIVGELSIETLDSRYTISGVPPDLQSVGGTGLC